MVVNLLVDNALANEELVTITSEDIIAGFADEVAEAREEAGKTVQWPAGMTFEDASTQYDYPQDIWQEAKARYDKLPPTEQQELIAEEQEMISSFMEIMSSEVKDAGFRESFGPFDLLWLGLAAFTAFKVGSAEAD
jgi:hypothetical protein